MTDPYQAFAAPPVHPAAAFTLAPATPLRRNGVAITALVLSIVALLGVLGIATMWFIQMAMGSLFMGMPGEDFMSDEYTLTGTAPQVVDGQTYTGERLTREVERVLENDWSTHRNIECADTVVIEAGAEVSCTGTVDGMDSDMTVEFEDDQGHFTLVQRY